MENITRRLCHTQRNLLLAISSPTSGFVVQRADHGAVTVSSRAVLHETLQPVDTGSSQSPCLLCESADTQDKRNVVCISEML